MKKTIINEYQLDHLVDIGVLYKCRDETYKPLISHNVWGYVCMPQNMVDDVAGKTVDVKVDKRDDGADRWVTDDEKAWFIQPWMLVDYYDNLKMWGKYMPVPSEDGDDPGIDVYILKIISSTHLEELAKNGIVRKEHIADDRYVYKPNIAYMGDNVIPDMMAEQICGRTLRCTGTDTTWIETETEHRWTISQWMLDNNYEYLLSRKKGYLKPEDLDEEEEEEEEEEEIPDWCEASVVGVIEDTNPEYITINCSEMSIPVLCYGDAESHGIGERVKVRGKLRRVHNMMGYPEIEITYIEEY